MTRGGTMATSTVRLLLNDEMASAIVHGRKTVTRRPVTPNPSQRWWLKSAQQITGCPNASMLKHGCGAQFEHPGGGPFTCIDAPCAPGDLLIGRECWAENVPGCEFQGGVSYRADHSDKRGDGPAHPMKWRPSIHMPDRAARIRRRVVSVTVERLQDVTEEDAVREGMQPAPDSDGRFLSPLRHRPNVSAEVHNARQAFRLAWDAIYAARGLRWNTNPWVWRIEFEGNGQHSVSTHRVQCAIC